MLLAAPGVTQEPVQGQLEVSYVVAVTAEQPDDYGLAAFELARDRGATLVRFDPEDLEPLELRLRELEPRFVAFVLEPEFIHTNFIRRVLMMSTRLDTDPFCDFSWGLITGASAEDALAFVRNIRRAREEGVPRRFTYSFVTSQSIPPSATGPAWLAAAGYEVKRLGFGTKDEGIAAFVTEHLHELEGQGLVKMTGCGDPERIWLFDDHRNLERDKHWAYAPEKIGANPDGEMNWIDAEAIRKLDLFPAVLTSGTCHCGSVERVFVEGDIVSTFGTSERVETYDMPAAKSLGLAYLGSGVSAAILPVGPNHGYRTDVEVRRMFSTGAPLGEVMRSCAAELVLAFGGAIELGLYDPEGGEADHGIDAIMRGGAANRVLYGDPSFSPFERLDVEPVSVAGPSRDEDGNYRLSCQVVDKSAPVYVDQFNRYRSRLFFAVDLPEPLAAAGIHSLAVLDDPDNIVAEVRWAEEQDGATTRLHVMAFSMRDPWDGGLGSRKDQVLQLRLDVASDAGQRVRVGSTLPPGTRPRAAAGPSVKRELDGLWGYEWRERRWGDVLSFIENHLERQRGTKCITFIFDDEVASAADRIVTLKLDSEPLRAGLDRICEELGLTYTVDEAAKCVRFHRAGTADFPGR